MALLMLAVGWFWFGWGYVANNEEILDSLPVPPGTHNIWTGSHPYSGNELIFSPPDGWGTLATYVAPPGTSREGIVDFYQSQLSPEWQSCVDQINVVELSGTSTKMMGNAFFVNGTALVSIDTQNITTDYPPTFDIFVDHQRDFDPSCHGPATGSVPPLR